MPVILHTRNISTELKITNGSQGFVRKIITAVSDQGFTYCVCAIVEFPDSPIELDGLPQGHFPIQQSKFSFTHTLMCEGSRVREKLHVTRRQLPIQPGFAVTGHSAQGKTLPKFLTFLNEGGFAAYVSASRATAQEGLCIVQPVILSDLNKPLPNDLRYEMRCQAALENNTTVRYGFVESTMVPIPEPEGEVLLIDSSPYPGPGLSEVIILPDSNSSKKRSPVEAELTKSDSYIRPVSKKAKLAADSALIKLPSHYTVPNIALFMGAGCSWSAENWSCAYDSVFMALFVPYICFSETARREFSLISPVSARMSASFDLLASSGLPSSQDFTYHHDLFCDILSHMRLQLLSCYSCEMAAVTDVLETIFPSEHWKS